MFAVPKPPKAIKKSRPTRDEFELEEVANQLTEAMESKKEVVLKIWNKDKVQGMITKMDGNTKLIHVKAGLNDVHYISFMDILAVDYPLE